MGVPELDALGPQVVQHGLARDPDTIRNLGERQPRLLEPHHLGDLICTGRLATHHDTSTLEPYGYCPALYPELIR